MHSLSSTKKRRFAAFLEAITECEVGGTMAVREIGESKLALTAGWPAIRATHKGSQWLGISPTGREVEMGVADWYHLNRDNQIADNWVMIDIPHILDQMDLDLIDDLRFFAKPDTPRLD